MKLFTIFIPLLLVVAVNFSANSELKTPCSVGLVLSGGGIDFKEKDTDGVGVGQHYFHYNYQFAQHYYLEVGLVNAEDNDDRTCDKTAENAWDSGIDEDNRFSIDADNFCQDSLIVAFKTDLALSKHNRLYAKVGTEFYQYELSLNGNKLADKSGVGLYAEAGWEYRWDNGMGINIGVRHHDFGDLKTANASIGGSYAF